MTRFIVLLKELHVQVWLTFGLGYKRNLYSYEEFNSCTVYCETRNLKCILLRGNYETCGNGDKWNQYTLKEIGNYINLLFYWEAIVTFTLKRHKLLARGTHNSPFLNVLLCFIFVLFILFTSLKMVINYYFYYSIIDGVYGIRPSDDS